MVSFPDWIAVVNPAEESINGNSQFEAEVQWEHLLTAKNS